MKVIDRLAPLATAGMSLGLDAMRDALAHYGNPQRSIPCVHVAGTNGKGSVVAMVDAVLRAGGMRVGRYTSPHLHRFVERIAVDGEDADEARLLPIVDEVLRAREDGDIPPLSFFEVATLAAWMYFRDAGVEAAVIEVGLGGRLDATTVCAPVVTAITRIALDHTALLGDSLAKVAREKAGILKPGVKCVLGPSLSPSGEREAYAAIRSVAEAVGAPLQLAPVVSTEPNGAVRVPWTGGAVTLHPTLVGAHQVENLAVVTGVCAHLARMAWPVDAKALDEGVGSTRWPCRLERVADDLIVDGAHNEDGVDALMAALPTVLRGRRLGAVIYGASRDKPWASMGARVCALVPRERRFFTAAALPRAVSGAELAAVIGGVDAGAPLEALSRARGALGDGEVALAFGSLYAVAAVRAAALGIESDPPVGL
ncbi:MAG: folylpolyglutamate synthase/dihydrofolate synthase family protein [Polyangiales bacterium]